MKNAQLLIDLIRLLYQLGFRRHHFILHTLTAVLSSPGMLRLFIGQFFVYGQLFLSFAILPLYTEHLGGTATTVGLHTALLTGVAVVLRFYLGPLADTHGRKLPLLLGAFVFASANAVLPLADSLALLGLVRAYQAIGVAAYLSASSALVLDLAPATARGAALSLNRSVVALALLLFPGAAEQVVTRWGFTPLFLGIAALTALGFACLASISAPAGAQSADPLTAAGSDDEAAGLLGGFLQALRQPGVPAALAAMSVTVIAHLGATSFLPLYIQDQGRSGFGTYFLALGLAAFGAGLSGSIVDRFGPRSVLTVALISTAAGVGGLYLSIGLPVLVLCGVLVGAGYTLALSAAPSLIDRAVPGRLRATAMALMETALDGGIAVAFPLLGALTAAFGYQYGFLSTAVLCLATVWYIRATKQ